MGKERASAAQGKVRTVDHLLDRAQKGDAQALAELRPLLDQAPGWWDEVGNIAQQAEEMLVSTAAGENVLVKEAYTRRLATLREELAGPVVTPLERLLIDRVVACWFHLHYVEANYAQALKDRTLSGKSSEDCQRRLDRAHRRYLAAIKTLATVRRLLTPAVQVNIAERQLNVSS